MSLLRILSEHSIDTFLFPLSLVLVAGPLCMLLFGTLGRYYVRVGHIAVLTRMYVTGRRPRRQLRAGMGVVRKTFVRATVFFVVNRMVRRTVAELRHVTDNMLAGLGPLVLVVNMFKSTFLNYIDECCLSYTYFDRKNGPFAGAVKGIVVYVNGWKSIAVATLRVMFTVFLVSLVFYAVFVLLIINAVVSGEYLFAAACAALLFFFRTAKVCVMDSYVMIVMLCAFLNEAKKQGEITLPRIMNVAALSGEFYSLLYQANRDEKFMDGEHDGSLLFRPSGN